MFRVDRMYNTLPYGVMVMDGQVYIYKYVWVPRVKKWERILAFNLCVFKDFDIPTTQKNMYYFPR